MSEDTKDMLEFPLEQVSIPQAIVLMMQAATKCVSIDGVGTNAVAQVTDLDRLQLLAEKLEARVEDELEAARAVRTEATPEDGQYETEFSNIDGHNVSLVHEYVEFAQDNVITKVVVDNVVFALLCNERVFTDPETLKVSTCIKRWGHANEHTDMEGNYR